MSEGRSRTTEVLYVWPYLEWGGVQIYFAGIMKLARERYAVRAVMPNGSAERLLSYMKRLDVPCEFFDAHLDASPALSVWHKVRRRWRKARCEFVIARHLSRHPLKRSILHMDFGPWSSFWLLLYLSLRSNVLVTLHIALPVLSGVRGFEWRLKFRALCSLKGFHLLASNREMLESLRAYVPPRFMKTVRVAYSGIDQDEIKQALAADFNRDALCEKYGLPRDRFLVFSLGQMVERKGYRVLLEAARRFKQRDARQAPYFVWVGTATRNPSIEDSIDEQGLRDSFRVITSGEIGQSRHDLLMLLRLADLFALPSLSEGLPVSLVEMMALGKACVASNINAIPEAIKDHQTGVLVAAGDAAGLACAISELQSDAALRERLAAAGQAYALANFDERIAARTTLDYYDACCQAV
ncbi:MAG: glycosyltransferase family 4 protein [Pyrinomonadaceae bacterium]